MKRTRFLRPRKKQTTISVPKNDEIKDDELKVIDEEGGFLGILKKDEALALAREKELDLVEISPKASPPIAKLMDYGKYVYQQEKQKRKQKTAKIGDIKGIRLSTRIGKHDQDVRLKQAEKFLQKGNKIKIELILKGRERQHAELSQKVIHSFLDELGEKIEFKIEQPIKRQGHVFSTLIAPKS